MSETVNVKTIKIGPSVRTKVTPKSVRPQLRVRFGRAIEVCAPDCEPWLVMLESLASLDSWPVGTTFKLLEEGWWGQYLYDYADGTPITETFEHHAVTFSCRLMGPYATQHEAARGAFLASRYIDMTGEDYDNGKCEAVLHGAFFDPVLKAAVFPVVDGNRDPTLDPGQTYFAATHTVDGAVVGDYFSSLSKALSWVSIMHGKLGL